MGRKRQIADISSNVDESKQNMSMKKMTVSSLSKVRFLIKSEPYEYNIEQLENDGYGQWDGVRNHQAKNILCKMKLGDLAYFYYSNNKSLTGIHGIVEVIKEAYPDPTAFDTSHKYYDPKSKSDAPKWMAIQIKLYEKLSTPILLKDMRNILSNDSKCPLKSMMLFNNSRLSVQEVQAEEAEFIASILKS
jgi:predicted RNA-binding protein with PUA-like domain